MIRLLLWSMAELSNRFRRELGLKSNIAIALRGVNFWDHNASTKRKRIVVSFTDRLTKYNDLKSNILIACFCICVAVVHAETSESSAFEPTIPNKNSPPGKAPEGMVWIPGGEFSMGASVSGKGSAEMPMASNDSGPIHRVRVDGFWIDTTPVTNEQFEKFVKATGYVTIAERKPTQEEFPTAPEENLVAGSVV